MSQKKGMPEAVKARLLELARRRQALILKATPPEALLVALDHLEERGEVTTGERWCQLKHASPDQERALMTRLPHRLGRIKSPRSLPPGLPSGLTWAIGVRWAVLFDPTTLRRLLEFLGLPADRYLPRVHYHGFQEPPRPPADYGPEGPPLPRTKGD